MNSLAKGLTFPGLLRSRQERCGVKVDPGSFCIVVVGGGNTTLITWSLGIFLADLEMSR